MVKITVRLEHIINEAYDVEIMAVDANISNLCDVIQKATHYTNGIDDVVKNLRNTFADVGAEEDTSEYENSFRYKITGVEKL